MPGNELIAEHGQMVHGLAHQLRRELSFRGEVDDLIAFGFGGLLEAQHRFDPGRGVRFQTFAYHRVRGAMLDGVRKMAGVPRRAHHRLQSGPPELERAFMRIRASLTENSPVHGRYGDESPETLLLKSESIGRLLAALAALSPRERFLVRARHFDARPLDEVARELGVSKSWASRLHGRALERLREALESG